MGSPPFLCLTSFLPWLVLPFIRIERIFVKEDKWFMSVRLISLASGSSGNCYFVGTPEYGILIDAGIGSRTIKKRLKEYGIDMSRILAVLVTHDHYDHVKSVAVLGEVYHLPIYSTEKVHLGISFNKKVTEKLSPANMRVIENGVPFEIKEMKITSFPLPHDAKDNSGYVIEVGNKTLTIATDLGNATSELRTYIAHSDYLILESNYDEDMLTNGSYPEVLKRRILGSNGHLSNADAAQLLSESATDKLKQVCLCHLSKENNHPNLAVETVSSQLKTKTKVVALPRNEAYCLDLI